MLPEAIWSLVSTCGNLDFRYANYKHLAHEIDAETVGVLDTVEILRKFFGEFLMFLFLAGLCVLFCLAFFG